MASSDPLDTPMMRQYLATKAEHPDCLLFMRMGDFYETFLQDAEDAAALLGITLTSRNKDAENPVAMAGVPHHSLAQHIPKLLAAGRRVALMDQLENPQEAKGLVKRGLSRIISAGTCLEEDFLEAGQERLLVAIKALSGATALAACDCAGGGLWVEYCNDTAALMNALARWQPAEILLPTSLSESEGSAAALAQLWEGAEAPPQAALPDALWRPEDGRRWLAEQYAVLSLDGFGLGSADDDLVSVAAAVLRYAQRNAGGPLPHMRRIQRLGGEDYMVLDAHCQRTLELVRNQRDGSRRHTLIESIDHCRSAPGSRLLARWLLRPLLDEAAIAQRHEAVGALLHEPRRRAALRAALDSVYDMERLLGRVASGRANARDLIQLASSLRAAAHMAELLSEIALPDGLLQMLPDLTPPGDLIDRITQTLVDDPPLSIEQGGMIRDGVDADLDANRALRSGAGEWLARYQHQEAERIGIKQLKVGYNKVFGYYIELGKQYADRVPEEYTRKQTLVGAERYITPELKDYEDQALGAEDRIRSRERQIFESLRNEVVSLLDPLQACAEALSHCDVLAALAELAQRGNWCRPVLDQSLRLELTEARHPVIERALGAGRFIANDCRMDADEDAQCPRLSLITGPNMAGKSTYIRQVALAVILAQAGSFVPAQSAHIGLVDRVFTRIGAGDELARNMSTFMVEMAETAAILNNASRRSLVILDEVGRGTSTFDGLSLAWAITEHLHDRIACRSLFATHYHELTDLAGERSGIHNCTVEVAEQDDEVVFLHRIIDGAATKSYGIHVARLAGVPAAVLQRAREVLGTLDELNICLGERERPGAHAQQSPQGDIVHQPAMQLNIFSQLDAPTHPLVDELAALDSENCSPRQAWEILDRFITRARSEGKKRPS